MLLILIIFISCFPCADLIYSQDNDELIDIEFEDETPEKKPEIIKEKEKDKKKEEPEGDNKLEEFKPGEFISKFNFNLYGSFFYTFTADQKKESGSKEYNEYHIENVNTETIMGLRIFNKSDLSGFAEFNFSSVFSYYDFVFYRMSIDLNREYYKFKFFYRERFYDFNDGLRLLDNEYYSYSQPIKFYKQPVEKTAQFGKNFYGTCFEYDNYFNNKILITAPSQSTPDNTFMIIDQFSIPLSLINLNVNFIYKKENYDLPEVNDSNWAEYKGTWYEFNTNTFYDSPENDYQIKATGEVNLKIVDMIFIWAEAGVDNQYGGYYARTSQKAVSSGNIPYTMIIKADNFKSFIMGSGVQLDFGKLILEGDFRSYKYKKNSFYYTTNVILREIQPEYNDISIRFKLDLSFINSANEISMLKTGSDSISIKFDEYNFFDIYLQDIIKRQKIRSFNIIDLKFIKLYPEAEVRNYSFISNQELKTLEFNQGVLLEVSRNVSLYLNARYKVYDFSEPQTESINKNYMYPFADIIYYFTKNIFIGLSYGLDPRLIYKYKYGFEYRLNNELDIEDFNVNTISEVENKLSKNNFIVLRGMISF